MCKRLLAVKPECLCPMIITDSSDLDDTGVEQSMRGVSYKLQVWKNQRAGGVYLGAHVYCIVIFLSTAEK